MSNPSDDEEDENECGPPVDLTCPGQIQYDGTANHIIDIPAKRGLPFKRILVTARARYEIITKMISVGWQEEHFSALDHCAIESLGDLVESIYWAHSPWFRRNRRHRYYYCQLNDLQVMLIAELDPRLKAVTIKSFIEASLPPEYEVERVIAETQVDVVHSKRKL